MQTSPTAKLEDFCNKIFRTKKRRETLSVGRAREKAVAVRSNYLKLNLKALMLNGTTSALNTFHAVQIFQKSQPIRNNAPNVVLNQVATHVCRKNKEKQNWTCAKAAPEAHGQAFLSFCDRAPPALDCRSRWSYWLPLRWDLILEKYLSMQHSSLMCPQRSIMLRTVWARGKYLENTWTSGDHVACKPHTSAPM